MATDPKNNSVTCTLCNSIGIPKISKKNEVYFSCSNLNCKSNPESKYTTYLGKINLVTGQFEKSESYNIKRKEPETNNNNTTDIPAVDDNVISSKKKCLCKNEEVNEKLESILKRAEIAVEYLEAGSKAMLYFDKVISPLYLKYIKAIEACDLLQDVEIIEKEYKK